ncbi:MAG: hypothetical protein IJM87_10725 [Ruminococcus sp.]|nr:hypothetical protein [Ruminococcus sp.]
MSAGIVGLIFGVILGALGGSIATAMYFITKPPEDPSITQKNNEALADYCTVLLEKNKELKHAVRHCYNAMSELGEVAKELEDLI